MSTVTIDDVVLRGATELERSGGWQAPEQAVDRGDDYSSFVRTEPSEIRIQATVTSSEYQQLEAIRRGGEPFPASVGSFQLAEAKLEDLSVTDTGDGVQHNTSDIEKGFTITIRVKEIEFAETDTAEIQFENDGDNFSSSSDSIDPTRSGSEQSDGLLSGVATSVSNAANSLSSSIGL